MDALIAIGASKAADYLGGKLVDKLVQRFHTDVIQRWNQKQAENFFQSFCEEVAKEIPGQENGNADILLDMILENEARTEALFDSYRRVCMSRSKDLGPRIIVGKETATVSRMLQACARGRFRIS